MVYKMTELRAVALGEAALSDFNDRSAILDEAAIRECFIMDEAYFGRNNVKQIEDIMNRIEAKIKADPMVDLDDSTESKELDAALVKIFGFKSAHVYWERTPSSNPCTLPSARAFGVTNDALRYPKSKTGMYDNTHTMVVFVQMDTGLVSNCHCTGAEMTAVLLHEIGHNFDYTPFALLRTWFDIINILLDSLRTGRLDQAVVMIATRSLLTGTDAGRQLYMELMNIVDKIGKALPPIGYVVYGLNAVKAAVNKLINMILIPVMMPARIPIYLMTMPLSYLNNFFLRKSESYADSFATAYGYGPEVITGLEKIMRGSLTFSNAPRGLFAIFDNFTMLYQEIVTLAHGGHGTQQQRARKMIDALRRDLKDPHIDAATRKACEKELDRIEATYNGIIYLQDDAGMFLTKALRMLMDQWYKGTAPNLMPIMDPENTYV
ncbi:MAG: hypothetical protein NC311_05830 [Muribaculaceae bacterium]|nr:hypothetical protein [Muribaculaceae bacterium]